MTNQQALTNLKQLCDGALKMGLIGKTEDAALLHEMFLLIQKRLSEPDTSNNKQFQPPIDYPKTYRETNGPRVQEPASY